MIGMKKLGLQAIILGVVAVGVALYGMIETQPNYEWASRDYATDPTLQMLYNSYREALEQQSVAAIASGAGGVVAGALAATWKKEKHGWIGVGLGVIGLVIGLMIKP